MFSWQIWDREKEGIVENDEMRARGERDRAGSDDLMGGVDDQVGVEDGSRAGTVEAALSPSAVCAYQVTPPQCVCLNCMWSPSAVCIRGNERAGHVGVRSDARGDVGVVAGEGREEVTMSSGKQSCFNFGSAWEGRVDGDVG